jgi:hypothetical protein
MSGKQNYYSKQNPNGPYAAHRVGPCLKPENYIEGQSTKKNLTAWTNYSFRNSDDPSITGKKLE